MLISWVYAPRNFGGINRVSEEPTATIFWPYFCTAIYDSYSFSLRRNISCNCLSSWSRGLLQEFSHSNSQEIIRLLWNPKVHIRVHNSPPFAPVSSEINPIHIFTPYLFEVHFNIILPATPVSPNSLHFRFSYQPFCMHLSLPCVLNAPPVSSSS